MIRKITFQNVKFLLHFTATDPSKSEKYGKFIHKLSFLIKFSVQRIVRPAVESSQVIGILLVVIKCLTLLWHPNKLVFKKKMAAHPPWPTYKTVEGY